MRCCAYFAVAISAAGSERLSTPALQRQLQATFERIAAIHTAARGDQDGQSSSTEFEVDTSVPFVKALADFTPFFRMYKPYIAGFRQALQTWAEVSVGLGRTIVSKKDIPII